MVAAEDKLTDLPAEQKSSYLHSFRVDLLENELEYRRWEAEEGGGGGGGAAAKAAKLAEATKICDALAQEIDPIRKNYWEYFSRSLVSRFGDTNKATGDNWKIGGPRPNFHVSRLQLWAMFRVHLDLTERQSTPSYYATATAPWRRVKATAPR